MHLVDFYLVVEQGGDERERTRHPVPQTRPEPRHAAGAFSADHRILTRATRQHHKGAREGAAKQESPSSHHGLRGERQARSVLAITTRHLHDELCAPTVLEGCYFQTITVPLMVRRVPDVFS